MIKFHYSCKMPSKNKHNDEKQNRTAGIITTIVVHVCLLFVLLFTISLAEPHPESLYIALEVELDEEIPDPVKITPPPLPSRAPEALARKPQERSAAGARPEVVAPKEPPAPSTVDPVGDVETPAQAKPTNPRTLYQSDDVGTVTAQAVGGQNPHGLYTGGSYGTDTSNRDGDATSWNLGGRKLVGELPKPDNENKREGRVVVDISVDQSGKVITAKARLLGSTVQDATLWKAAEEAAMKSTFSNVSRTQPVQHGTITYVFKLR
ncbi:MAG: hypothetical protein LBH91_05045 [Prevotellaceae bacterium]|jgi:TonB family protein|nr:hypothetical protein [Prevotellaceae bacterium]